MSDDHSVTNWIGQLKHGDQQAAQALWERYYQSLVRMARRRLADANRRVADEEDIALSAFDSFCQGAVEGRFPRLEDRDDLWKLLVVMTARKVATHKKHGARLKRGAGQVRGDSVFQNPDQTGAGIGDVIGETPTPDFAVQMAEECELRLRALDSELRQLAQWKLEGYTNGEIAQRIGRSERAVERKLHRIRLQWQTDEQGDSDAD